MSIGRTFKEALQKGIRSMEVKRFGLGLDRNDKWLKRPQARRHGAPSRRRQPGRGHRAGPSRRTSSAASSPMPCQGRLYYIRYAFKMGWTVEQVYELTKIDPWFLAESRSWWSSRRS